jgi:hypothetical protein
MNDGPYSESSSSCTNNDGIICVINDCIVSDSFLALEIDLKQSLLETRVFCLISLVRNFVHLQLSDSME